MPDDARHPCCYPPSSGASVTHVTAIQAETERKRLFAHLKRILRLDRLPLRGPNGAKDEFLLAATVQNLRKLAKLIPATQ